MLIFEEIKQVIIDNYLNKQYNQIITVITFSIIITYILLLIVYNLLLFCFIII